VIYPRLVYFQGLHRQQSIKSVPLPSCARFHQVQENPDGKGSLMGRLSAVPADLTEAANPTQVLRQDRAAFRTYVVAFALGAGALFALGIGFVTGGATVMVRLVAGLVVGLGVGLGVGLWQASWGAFSLARVWLAAHDRLPRDLMAFSADAHRRGVLRQVGAVYQFRHIELQRRLANRER